MAKSSAQRRAKRNPKIYEFCQKQIAAGSSRMATYEAAAERYNVTAGHVQAVIRQMERAEESIKPVPQAEENLNGEW